MQLQSIAALCLVQPGQFFDSRSNFTTQDELDVVEGRKRHLRQEDALHQLTVPGGQVGQDKRAGADLKGGVLAVDVDQIDGVLDGYAQAAL